MKRNTWYCRAANLSGLDSDRVRARVQRALDKMAARGPDNAELVQVNEFVAWGIPDCL